MNRVKFMSVWLLIFGVLAVFSAYSVEALSGAGANKAYAATIKSDSELEHSDHLAVVHDSHPGFNGREFLCSVNNSQFQQLQSLYGATIEQVNIHGTPTSFVTVHKHHGLNRRDLKQAIGETHCHIILRNHLFYMLFRSDVS